MAHRTNKRGSPALSKADWLDALDEAEVMAVSQVNHPPGKGWKTFAQVAAAMPRVGKQRIYRWLREEIAAGRMEAYRGSALNAVGRVSQQVWYRRRQRVRSPRQPAPGSTDP